MSISWNSMSMFPYGLQHVIARTIIGDQISCVNILFYVSHLWGPMHGISKTPAGSRSKMSCARYYPKLQIVLGARLRTIRRAMYVWIKKMRCIIVKYVDLLPNSRHILLGTCCATHARNQSRATCAVQNSRKRAPTVSI